MKKKILGIFGLILIIFVAIVYNSRKESSLPLIAIANWGPHSSLEASMNGLKEQLQLEGFFENKTVQYEITDVGFDASLIPQMITKLKNHNPKVMIVVSTPIAQYAKGKIKDISLVYSSITDPVEAGLLVQKNTPNGNITGSSDMQDLKSFLKFVKTILPNAKTVGLLYATAESNDIALVKMMRSAADSVKMSVIAIPIEQARDVHIRVQEFKGKVDFIYVGTSGPIQPALPAIAAEAKKMNIPVFNVNTEEVRNGLAFGSFGVNYNAVGMNAGKLVAALLKGKPISELRPIYPAGTDHEGLISRKKAIELGIQIPDNIKTVE